jgi:hypothetical protein
MEMTTESSLKQCHIAQLWFIWIAELISGSLKRTVNFLNYTCGIISGTRIFGWYYAMRWNSNRPSRFPLTKISRHSAEQYSQSSMGNRYQQVHGPFIELSRTPGINIIIVFTIDFLRNLIKFQSSTKIPASIGAPCRGSNYEWFMFWSINVQWLRFTSSCSSCQSTESSGLIFRQAAKQFLRSDSYQILSLGSEPWIDDRVPLSTWSVTAVPSTSLTRTISEYDKHSLLILGLHHLPAISDLDGVVCSARHIGIHPLVRTPIPQLFEQSPHLTSPPPTSHARSHSDKIENRDDHPLRKLIALPIIRWQNWIPSLNGPSRDTSRSRSGCR